MEDSALMIVGVERNGRIGYLSSSAEKVFGSIRDIDLAHPPPCDDPRGPLASLVALWDSSAADPGSPPPKVLRAKLDGSPIFLWLQSLPLAGGGKAFIMADMTAFMSGSEPVKALVSQLAHDLRSPLTSISGAAELLLSGRVGDLVGAQARLVKIVDEGTRKMGTIISNVYEEGREGGAAR